MKKIIRIILADEDTDDTDLFTLILQRLDDNLRIEIAEDGEALLHQLETEALPALVLLNLNLPRIAGKDCLQYLRSNERLNTVPIVVLSTCNQLQVKYDCLSLGADDYFIKPRSIAGVEYLLKNICEQHLALNKMMSA